MLIEKKAINQKQEEFYPIEDAIYMTNNLSGKIDLGIIFIQCPFCEKIYKREHKLAITDLEPNYCSKCKEFSAIYKINWQEDVKKENIHHTIYLYSWQPKNYRKGEIKKVLKQKGKLVGLFKLKEKRQYDDYQIGFKTEKEIREDERKKVLQEVNPIYRLLKEEGIIKSKEEIEKIIKETPHLLNEKLQNIIKEKEREKQQILKKLDKQEKRILKLEKDNLTCPLCFRKFDKIKSFTNHIREYRVKLQNYERLKEKNLG
jgi:hypothetical protein